MTSASFPGPAAQRLPARARGSVELWHGKRSMICMYICIYINKCICLRILMIYIYMYVLPTTSVAVSINWEPFLWVSLQSEPYDFGVYIRASDCWKLTQIYTYKYRYTHVHIYICIYVCLHFQSPKHSFRRLLADDILDLMVLEAEPTIKELGLPSIK